MQRARFGGTGRVRTSDECAASVAESLYGIAESIQTRSADGGGWWWCVCVKEGKVWRVGEDKCQEAKEDLMMGDRYGRLGERASNFVDWSGKGTAECECSCVIDAAYIAANSMYFSARSQALATSSSRLPAVCSSLPVLAAVLTASDAVPTL